MVRCRLAIGLGLAVIPLACSGADEDPGLYTAGEASASSEDGLGSDSAEDSGSATNTASSTNDDTSTGTTNASSSSGPVLDIGTSTNTGTAEGGSGEGCEKVDFLFVVDNSISMGDEQTALGLSFPQFIDTIQNEVVGDYHVMVVDTDPEDKWDEELVEC